MTPGEKIALQAMKKELARLSRVAEKAKAEAEEASNVGTEFISIHKEFVELMKGDRLAKDFLPKLEALRSRKKKADTISKKDIIKLFDKQHDTAFERDQLAMEVQRMEFRHSLRK